MIFWSFVLLVVALLLALAFLYSAAMAWLRPAMQGAAIELKKYAALAILGRYYHRRACTCHVDDQGIVQVDPDCLKWTRVAMRLERARRQMLRAQIQKVAQKNDGPGVTRARNQHLN
jgi:hypothetical protein